MKEALEHAQIIENLSNKLKGRLISNDQATLIACFSCLIKVLTDLFTENQRRNLRFGEKLRKDD